jgi:DNA polymerase III alpha subunit
VARLTADVLREAEKLEGSVRGTGIHAAGIIIAPSDLTEIIPVCTSKESNLLLTQYDGKVIEDAGVIKMDFLGLKTLTIIRDALRMIKANHGIGSTSTAFRWTTRRPSHLPARRDQRHLPVRKRGDAEVPA